MESETGRRKVFDINDNEWKGDVRISAGKSPLRDKDLGWRCKSAFME